MLNTEDTGSMENLFEIRRYQIDIDNEQVANLSQYLLETFPFTNCDLGKSLRHFALKAFFSSWENNAAEAQPYYNQFDFPKVNPNYYGRYPAIRPAEDHLTLTLYML